MRGRSLLLLGLVFLVSACIRDGPGPTPSPTGSEGSGADLAILHTDASDFKRIVCDDGGCMRRLTQDNVGPSNEVMVAMDASAPTHLLAAAKDYHSDDLTCTQASVYASSDGGRTWSAGYARPGVGVNGAPDSTTYCESDPVLTFDGLGNGYLFTLGAEGVPNLRNPIHVHAYRTPDVGGSWENAGLAFTGPNDKNWAAADLRSHRVYSLTGLTCGGEAITWSDDQGATWQGPSCIKGMSQSQIAVAPDGTVWVVGNGEGGVSFTRSHDAGLTWDPPVTIASPSSSGTHAYRTPTMPSLAIALGTGAVYVAWHDAGEGDQDVYFAASFDQGASWKGPVVVNDQRDGSQFMPAVAASPNGDAHVVFFDDRNDATQNGNLLDAYYAHLALGDAAAADIVPEANIRLTPSSFAPYLSRHQNPQTGPFIGDYIGIAATNGEAVAVFPTTVSGRSEINAVIVGGST